MSSICLFFWLTQFTVIWQRETAHCHSWDAGNRNCVAFLQELNQMVARWFFFFFCQSINRLIIAALNYSTFRIIICTVLPVKILILYRIDVLDSILEIKLLTCFFSSVIWIKHYIISITCWCVCVWVCVVFWVQTSHSCIKPKILSFFKKASRVMILATYQVGVFSSSSH